MIVLWGEDDRSSIKYQSAFGDPVILKKYGVLGQNTEFVKPPATADCTLKMIRIKIGSY
jgi:hypothetical protein